LLFEKSGIYRHKWKALCALVRRDAPCILDTPLVTALREGENMARTVRDANLETRTARARLKARGKPYYRAIEPGLHLGYRKPVGGGTGKWVVRRYVGKQAYAVERIGTADDFSDADGQAVLDYRQVQEKARRGMVERAHEAAGKSGSLTVRQACESYIEFLRAHKKTGDDADGRLKKHVLPMLGDRPIVELIKSEIDKCHRAMVRRGDDPEVERKSKDSANRVLTSLKAALNRAFSDESNKISTDAAWRRVKPFENVGRARQVHLGVVQSNRLINVCTGALRKMVTATLLTGARAPHELASLRVRDFRPDLATLSINGGKTGSRDIVLTKEAVRWFREISAGRAPDELLLPRDDRTPWTRSEHTRDMLDAVAKAKLPKGCTIHSLRHTYASQSLLAGMNIKLLAENMGTSVRMIKLYYGKFIAAAPRKLIEESAFRLGLKAHKVTPLRAGAWLNRPRLDANVFEEIRRDKKMIENAAKFGMIMSPGFEDRAAKRVEEVKAIANKLGWSDERLRLFVWLVLEYGNEPNIENYLQIRQKFPEIEIQLARFGEIEFLLAMKSELERQGVNPELVAVALDCDEPAVDALCLHLLELCAAKDSLPRHGPGHIQKRRDAISDVTINYLLVTMLEQFECHEQFRIPASLVELARHQLCGNNPDLHTAYLLEEKRTKMAIVMTQKLKAGEKLSINKMVQMTGLKRATAARWLKEGFLDRVTHWQQVSLY
jgi:integrase